jgi:hypothetical protein
MCPREHLILGIWNEKLNKAQTYMLYEKGRGVELCRRPVGRW